MPFTWFGCLDGSSIDANKVDAFTVGQVQKHDTEGKPMFELADTEGKAAPVMQLCVFAIIGQTSYPIRVVGSMDEAQLTIQSVLAKLKAAYEKERGVIQVASADEAKSLRLK